MSTIDHLKPFVVSPFGVLHFFNSFFVKLCGIGLVNPVPPEKVVNCVLFVDMFTIAIRVASLKWSASAASQLLRGSNSLKGSKGVKTEKLYHRISLMLSWCWIFLGINKKSAY